MFQQAFDSVVVAELQTTKFYSLLIVVGVK